jgi:hypothetical protein
VTTEITGMNANATTTAVKGRGPIPGNPSIVDRFEDGSWRAVYDVSYYDVWLECRKEGRPDSEVDAHFLRRIS